MFTNLLTRSTRADYEEILRRESLYTTSTQKKTTYQGKAIRKPLFSAPKPYKVETIQ